MSGDRLGEKLKLAAQEEDLLALRQELREVQAALAAEQEAKRVMATELREARDEIWKLEEAYEIRMRDSDDTEAKLAASEAARERLEEALHRLETWRRAYPLKVFPEPDLERARDLLESGGMTLDAISASNMRHVIEQVGEIISAALASPPAQAGVQLPTLSKDQEEYLQKIADATNKYDPAHVVGGPAQAGASEADTYGLRGGPGRDFPCDDPKVSECAMGECQRQRRCVLRATPARDAVLEAQLIGIAERLDECFEPTTPMVPIMSELIPAVRDAIIQLRALSARRGEGCA